MSNPTSMPDRWIDPDDPDFNPLVNEPFNDPRIVEGGDIHYRDQLILVNVNDVDLVDGELRELGARPEPVDATVSRYVAVYRIGNDLDVLEVVRRLRALPGRREPRVGPNHVIFGEPNYHGGPYGDPRPAPPIPPVASRGNGYAPTIAVVDTGLVAPANLPTLLTDRTIVQPPDVDPVVDGAGNIDVQGCHGTMIAGVIARLAPDARLLSVRVLPSHGRVDEIDALRVLHTVLTANVELINASWGTHGYLDRPPAGLEAFVDSLPDHVVMVAAAGNGRTTRPSFPAAFKRVVGVTALDTTGGDIVPAHAFTNYGWWVDACAPGVNIHSVYTTGRRRRRTSTSKKPKFDRFKGWAAASGTSFAAPVVTGLIAAAMTNYRAVDTANDLLHGPGAYYRPGYGTQLLPPIRITYP